MEAAFVTGPAKNLIGFARRARAGVGGRLIELSVVTYERGSNPEPNPFVEAAREAGLRVDLVRERGRFDHAVVEQLRRIVDEHRPDIVQTHNVKSHFLMRWSGLSERYRWLAFHHGYTSTDWKMKVYNQLDRWSLRRPRHLVTVCGAFARQLEEIGVARSRITIRHNFIPSVPAADPAVASHLRQTIGIAAGIPILLSVGRLSHEKGHVDLVEALGLLKDQPFHLVIAGEGPGRVAIEESIARCGLRGKITLAGLQHNIQPYYEMADMVIMPSHSEGSPNALLEAMMGGLPIVATRVGGIPEIVNDGETAILVEARQPQALAEGIRKMLLEPEKGKQMGRAARVLAESGYSAEAYCRALTGLYQAVLAGT